MYGQSGRKVRLPLFIIVNHLNHNIMRRIISFIGAVLLMCSCIYEDLSDCPNYIQGIGKPVDVEFCVSSTDSIETKSSITASETAVANLNLFIYYAGKLEKSSYMESPTSFSISLVKGRTYNMYVLANMGKVTAPLTEEEMKGYQYSISKVTDIKLVLPMCWSLEDQTISGSGPRVNINLERMVSRINFSIDSSELEEFNITAVKLYQGALKMYPFFENGNGGSRASNISEVGDGDWASSSDLAKLNSGQKICFYALENCQGELLPGNKSADSKIPTELPYAADLCTYMELTASHSGDYKGMAVSSDNVTYRFYIGNDNCTDFNIRRNTDVNIHLIVTKDRIFDKGWKVDYGEDVPEITTDVVLTPASLTVYRSAKNKLTAIQRTFTDGTQTNATEISSACSWTSSNTSVATVDQNGIVSGISTGSAVVTCRYEDQTVQANITVKNASTYKVTINPSPVSLNLDDSQALTATYEVLESSSYQYRENVTSTATWSSSNTSVVTVSGGTLKAVGAGTATVTATFNGTKGSTTVTVTDGSITYDYVLSPETTSIVKGRSTKFTVVKRTFTNGTQTNGQDVSSTFSWTSSNTNVVTVDNTGVITGISKGTATITATYGSTTLTGTVTVTPAYTYELVLNKTSMSIAKGATGTIVATYKTYADGTLESSTNVTSAATWSSGSTSVASVSGGTVTGKGVGTATITATYNGKSATCSVTVVGSATLSLGWTSATMEKGSVRTNAAIYNPNNGTASTNVTSSAVWTTSNAGVATAGSGTITAQGKGTCTITVTYNGLSASCTVTVTDNDAPLPNAYVSNMSVQSVNIAGTSNYKLQLTIKFSDGTVIEDAPYTWSVTFAQNSAIATGTSGTGPLVYVGGGSTYTMAVAIQTKEYYYNSSGNKQQFSTGTSFSHNTSWKP